MEIFVVLNKKRKDSVFSEAVKNFTKFTDEICWTSDSFKSIETFTFVDLIKSPLLSRTQCPGVGLPFTFGTSGIP